MQVRVIGGSSANVAWARSGCLLVDGRVAFDSGGLASELSLAEQVAIDHVLLTHAHLDHIGELAFLADNVMTTRSAPLKIWAPGPILEQLRRHLFNNELWPDFSVIRIGEHPVVEFCPLEPDAPVAIDHLTIRWARTNHPVFSAGYLVAGVGGGTFLYTGDTGPTEAIWTLAAGSLSLDAVFVETAFPDRLQELALVSGHLTPSLLRDELDKLPCHAAIINVMHVKSIYAGETTLELQTLLRPWRIVSGGESFSLPT